MNDLEQRLRSLRRGPVPASLDRRVEASLRAHGRAGAGLASRPVPLWACAAACLAFLVAGLTLAPPRVRPAGPPVPASVRVIHHDPAFRALLAAEPQPTEYFLRTRRILP